MTHFIGAWSVFSRKWKTILGKDWITKNSYNFPLSLGNNPSPLSQFAQFAIVVRYQSDPMSPCLRYTWLNWHQVWHWHWKRQSIHPETEQKICRKLNKISQADADCDQLLHLCPGAVWRGAGPLLHPLSVPGGADAAMGPPRVHVPVLPLHADTLGETWS